MASWTCVFGFALSLGAPGEPREVKPAVNEVRTDVPPGERPYEMVWAGRTEKRSPVVSFEDLAGWKVELYGHAVATVERSREQRMWGDFAGKLTYRGQEGECRIILRPPQPIPVAGRFTAANLWCWGNNWGWVRRPDTPQVELALHLADARGASHRVSLGSVRWEEWWLVHRRVINHLGADPQFPFAIAGIEVNGGYQAEDRVIFFDSLSFYEEEWPELTFEPRPRRNLKPFPGQDHGLNTGPGTLPFPTREDTILPANLTEAFTNEVVAGDDGQYTFHYRGSDVKMSYVVTPQPAGLGDVRVTIDGTAAARALAHADVALAGTGEGTSELASVVLEGNVLRVSQVRRRGDDSAQVELRYRIRAKSLVVDVFCRGGQATALELGAFEELTRPEAIPIPYANFGGQSHALLARAAGKAFFATAWIDWYRSSASELFTRHEVGEQSARVNGGTRYLPKTDGRRNDLFERLFLTVSPLFEETLPTIANPPSRWGRVAGEYLWQESWGPGDFQKEHERSRRLRAYGIDKLIQCNHEIAWRDNADSFTLRTRAAPKKGGDEALAEYVRRQKSLGWRSGLYSNYCDFAPVNENWDENAVQLEPNREWRTAWPRCYALKPSRAVEFDARYAPLVKKQYDPTSAYTDVHTAVAPWRYCDYDARVSGAGTFAATFYAYGELLLHDSKIYGGPIFSEGTYQCLYAGLPDGNYAIHYGGYNLGRDPILPHFDLYKIHPLSTDIGMGWTTNFCNWPGWNKPENLSTSIDRFILTTMAYGHLGWLVEESYGIDLTCRSYYSLQQLTRRYAMVPPESIEYFDGETLLSTSAALASGAHRDSQLRVVYQNGLELWLNGSQDKSWRLPPTAGGHLLPPTGWYVRKPGEPYHQVSALRGGRRYDLVVSPEYLYASGRGKLLWLDHVAVTGSVAIRAPDPDRLEILDMGSNASIGWGGSEPAAGMPADHALRRLISIALSRPPHADAYDVDGKSLGEAEVRHAGGKCWLLPVASGVRYELYRPTKTRGPALVVGCDRVEVFPGERLTATVTSAAGALSRESLRLSRPGADGERAREGTALEATADENGSRVNFRVPEDARLGEILWVRFTATVAETEVETKGWLALAVRQLADLEFTPDAAPLGDGRGETSIRGRLGLPARPATLVFEPPEWLAVEPARLEASGDVERTVVLRAARPQAGELRAVVTSGDATQTLVFDLAAGEANPEIARLYGGGTAFTWGLAFRDGRKLGGNTTTGASFHEEKSIVCGGVAKPGLFSHPPYIGGVGSSHALFEPIDLPAEPCELRLYVGIKDGGHPSDGVDFVVEAVRETNAAVEVLRVNTSRRAWRSVTTDLAALRGERVRFRLIADVGPNDNSTSDWASWGEPTIRLATPVPAVMLKLRP